MASSFSLPGVPAGSGKVFFLRQGRDPNRAEQETCSSAIQIGLLGSAIKGP
jgi:hypothetical protein